MKKGLVVDWLDKYGGAERVIKELWKVFSFDEVYTLINVMKEEDLKKIHQKGNDIIKETILKKTKKKFRIFFFTFHFFIEKIKINKEVDIIISSSHAVAKGIKKSNPNQLHISYFQARNFKFIWDEVELYFGSMKYLLFPLIYILRKTDCNQANNPDFIISNSNYVKEWVKKTYNRDSEVIYPPVDFDSFNLEEEKEDYYVTTSRLVPYKRVDVLVKAFNQNKKKLIIIGDGPKKNKLMKEANSNIVFKGYLDSSETAKIVGKSKAFVFASEEDFGIAPVEAQACGTPVIAFGRGGALETVIDNKTGVFFQAQTVESLNEAIVRFEDLTFNPVEIREQALKFSTERFESQIKSFVEEKWKEHINKI